MMNSFLNASAGGTCAVARSFMSNLNDEQFFERFSLFGGDE
jgi:hypothetical protein